jgi:hypothetical protein
MNEEQVESMKAQYAIRQPKIQLEPKTKLRLATELKEAASVGAPIFWNSIKNFFGMLRAAMTRPDLDLESWRRIECPNEYQEKRDPRNIDMHRWM